MSEFSGTAILALGGFLAFLILVTAMLRGWRDWLDLKRAQMTADHAPRDPVSPSARIELADLKERVRRLEAIANGVEG